MTAGQEADEGSVFRGLRSTVGRESTTFGFSILVTVTFGLLQALQGPPTVGQIFTFTGGAVLSFTLLEVALSKGLRRPMPQHHTRVQAIGTAMNFASVFGGLGTAWLVAKVAPDAAAWPAAPFLGAIVYLVLEGLETAVAERLASAAGDRQARDVSP